jgi:Ca2+-binding RTX toxin-like protein
MRTYANALALFVSLALAALAWADRIECGPNSCQGTNRDDVIIGTKQGEGIDAKRGDDVIRGRGGSDNAIRGDGGDDRLKGGGGPDQLGGGRGQDVLKGGPGFDIYFFNENNWGQEVVQDTAIADTDLNSGHFVRFDGVSLDLVINLTSGPGDEVRALSGSATLNWEDSLIDGVIDGSGDDSITGRAIEDNIQVFGGGEDVILAGGGNDFVYTLDGEPNDAISCGPGASDEARVDVGDSVDADCEVLTRRR